MKQPKTLPFYLQNGDYLDILDSEDVIIATVNTHQNELEVGDYIVEACNNYPKALKLLNYFVNRVEKGEIKSKTTYNKYKEFLKQIENEQLL